MPAENSSKPKHLNKYYAKFLKPAESTSPNKYSTILKKTEEEKRQRILREAREQRLEQERLAELERRRLEAEEAERRKSREKKQQERDQAANGDPLKAAYFDDNRGRIYDLGIPAAREANYFVIGCQGNGHASQEDVARLMNLIAEGKKPDFILFLGDNFYDHGISSPTDPIIKKNFTDIYGNPLLGRIADIPCFAILGNHDENYHNLRKPGAMKGPKRGMFQVARSYVAETISSAAAGLEKIFTTHSKRQLYKQRNIDLTTAPKWNMPARYYSLIAGNSQIFCIDSNTYVQDYLAYQAAKNLDRPIDPKNQAYWLETEVKKAKAAGRKVVLANHHPIMTPGKRAFGSDVSLYLENGDQTFFETVYKQHYPHKRKDELIRANKVSYNTLLRETFTMQWNDSRKIPGEEFSFDTIFAAHDHDLYYVNNKNSRSDDEFPVCEIVSGGGGGHLQGLMQYSPHLACFMKQNGFVSVKTVQAEFGEPVLQYHFYTTAAHDRKHHLVFNENSKEPIRDYSTVKNEKSKIEKFSQVVREAIEEYLNFIAKKQQQHHGKFFSRNITHGEKGVERAHKLWAYISNHEVDNYAKTINTVIEMTEWKSIFASPTEHSLITILEDKIQTAYDGKSLRELSLDSHAQARQNNFETENNYYQHRIKP